MKKIVPSFIELILIILVVILLSWGFWIYDGGLSPNEFGDAINPILGGITIYLIYKTFQLQKEELKKTSDALEGQENAMNDQRIQSLVIELITLSKSHIENFKIDLKKIYPTAINDIILVFLDGKTEQEIISSINQGRLNNAINYFRTLKYIETLLIDTYGDDKLKIKIYIELLDSQITDNVRDLYSAITSIKSGIDLEKITFEYLFTKKMTEFKNEIIRKPLRIARPRIYGI